MEAELKVYIDNGKLTVVNNVYNVEQYDLNPFALWIAPEGTVPDKFRYLLKGDS